MRRQLLVCWICCFSCSSIAQDAIQSNGSSINWEKSEHDFGNLYSGQKVNHTFRFVNTGSQPLIITNVEVTCGCTVPKGWPRSPIMPGHKGELDVFFDSTGKLGKQNKVVTVISNTATGSSQVTFTANVLEKKPNQH